MSELILDIDNLTQRYNVKLAQLNEVEIGELGFCSDLTYTASLVEIDELTFNMVSHYSDEQGKLLKTPYYDDLQADRLIILNDTHYFYIDTCSESTNEGYSTKTIHAYGREYELSFKSFNNYEPETERFLYFTYPTANQIGFPWTSVAEIPETVKEHLTSTIDKDGYYYGIFNEIESLTRWQLKKHSSHNPIMPSVRSEETGTRVSIKGQVRKITTSESNLLELMKQLQEAWGVFFEYDTKNRIITIKAIEDLLEEPTGELKPAIGVLSNENFVVDLNKELKNQEIKTRLYLYNSNGDGVVSQLTGHGQTYLEDYSYYRKPEYMSNNLLSALMTYDSKIAAAASTTRVFFEQYKALIEEKGQVETEIALLNEELTRTIAELQPLKILKEGYTVGEEVILEPGTLSPAQEADYKRLVNRISAITKEIEWRSISVTETRPAGHYFIIRVPVEEGETGDADGLKESLLDGNYLSVKKLEEKIAALKEQIKAHQRTNSMRQILLDYEELNGLPSYSLVDEMEPYIKEASYKSDAIEDAEELYRLGMRLIKTVSKPKMQFSLGVIDFLSLVELSPAWPMVSLGAILKIQNKDFDFNKDALLLKYTHTPSSQSLNLEFSEDLTLDSDTKFIADMIAKSSSIASQVSFNSNYWASGGAAGSGGGSGGGSGSGGVISNYFDTLYAKEIVTQKLVADEIEANQITVGLLIADVIEAEVVRTEALYAKTAEIETLIADTIEAEVVRTEELYAKSAEIDNLVAGIITADSVTTDRLSANYADIDLANIDTGVINTVLSKDLLASDGFITNLKVVSAQMVSLDASKISAGTISAERILITGSDPDNPNAKPLLLTLNNLGELVSENVDSLDGYLLTNNTVHAEKIIAESITAREIATGAITADKILAGTITAASGVIASLDASKLTVGTIDASKVAIANLSATSIKTGLLESINGAFFLDMTTGDFNLGGAIIKDGNSIRIIAGGVPIEEYVDGKMAYLIKSNPEQIFINTNHDGDIEESQSFSLDFSIHKGTDLKAATITGVHLQHSTGQVISTIGFSYSAIQPVEGESGKLNLTFDAGTDLPVDTGYVQCLITVAESSKQFFYKISWSKLKAPAKQYRVEVISTNGKIFKNNLIATVLKACVYEDNLDITSSLDASRFQWTKTLQNGTLDAAWNTIYASGYKEVPVTASDISERATFSCSIF